MRKSKWKLGKKLICLIMTCAICSQLCSVTAFAGQIAKFSLIHSPSGTPSENVLNWSRRSVTTTKTPTGAAVNRVGGGAVINVSTSNGINANFDKQGTVSVSTSIGKSINLYVRYEKYGSSYSNPIGNFSY